MGKEIEKKKSRGEVTIQLNLVVMIFFSMSLVVAAALVTYGLVKKPSSSVPDKITSHTGGESNVDTSLDIAKAQDIPAWGQFIERDFDLEQPDEYVDYETDTNRAEAWVFEGMTPDEARVKMQSSGLTADQIADAMQPSRVAFANSSTVITPDDDLVFSLPEQTRAKLYAVLAHFPANEFMHFPFCFGTNVFDSWFGDGKIDAETFSLLKKLVYVRGETVCFSDLVPLLQRVPDEKNRQRLVKALSRQSALLLGIRIWPDTDIDKLLGYWAWAPGVKVIDARPLLESMKRLPNGGGVGILYLLPPFARERLYTYPLPSQLGDPTMDCHWSTMNFFNATPDNRFSDPKYTSAYIAANFYPIAKPTAYGDVVLLLDENGSAIHSGVYLADNIIFTKNGNNFAQPWMLMRLKDLVAEYTTDVPPRVVVYRNKNW
jgi:hypothetical protein